MRSVGEYDVSSRMLNQTLRVLDRDGLVERRVRPLRSASRGVRLTQLGETPVDFRRRLLAALRGLSGVVHSGSPRRASTSQCTVGDRRPRASRVGPRRAHVGVH
ncbi:MAG: winged helix-turn-helix transcriptional regulator [Chloroflexota bacterium]